MKISGKFAAETVTGWYEAYKRTVNGVTYDFQRNYSQVDNKPISVMATRLDEDGYATEVVHHWGRYGSL